ncbi:MAG: hypothetical protein ACRDJ4_00850 [Actinomycetota bacterium]
MTDPSVFASGTTTGGVPWEAVEYMTRAGWICIDFRYWQVPAERSDLAALGGCFIDGSPETGRVMGNIWPSRETALVGLLEGPSSGLGRGRGVTIEFGGGGKVTSQSTEGGAFVAVGRGMPVGLTYESSSGGVLFEPWKRP